MGRFASAAAFALVLGLAAPGHALPIDGHERGFIEGANHHVGDAGFIAERHRAPTDADGEEARMHAHLTYIRAQLAHGPATRPELEPTRARLLSYLDDYIAKGITPKNEHLPWRTPVFIDDDGAICAVGYLIERSVGRALPETIARTHRYDLLEDIAAAMPEVREWVEASGFTLLELASIQPGYMAPEASTWHPWKTAPVADGPYESHDGDDSVNGAFKGGWMDGRWTRTKAGVTVGVGTFNAGKGTWTSLYANGKTMAEGAFDANIPAGNWRLFHASGNLAAEGRFVNGERAGDWRFYYDTDAHTLIAEGEFADRRIAGYWQHYDSRGRLLAVSEDVSAAAWRGEFGEYLLDILPGRDGVHQYVHQGNIAGDHHRLDMLSDGSEPIFVTFRDKDVYDSSGSKLVKADGHWTASDCHWSSVRKAAARAGDLVTVAALLSREAWDPPRTCDAPRPVAVRREAHLDKMMASLSGVRAQSPEFVRELALGDVSLDDTDEYSKTRIDESADLGKVLAANMTWYVEWPHVDGRFVDVFKTLPSYSKSSDE